MTTETRNVEKVINTRQQFYIAVDGKEFDSEDGCREYEEALKVVTNKAVLPMFKRVTEYNLFNGWAGCEDYEFGLVKVTEDNLAQLQLFMELNGGKGITYDDGTKHELTMDYIGKTCLFTVGYGDVVDGGCFCGSVNEWYAYMTNAMCEVLKLD